MVIKHHVEGYENFCKFFDDFDKEGDSKSVFVYFSGSKLPSGESWCDDCVRAAPIVEQAIEKCKYEGHFVYVEVGDRAFWKDMACPFRKDKKTNLMVIPTLIKWKHPKRLEGSQCEKLDLLELLFSDDED